MSVDWTIGRADGTRLRFVRVAYATRYELEELETITPGGTISRNLDADLKESGTLQCVNAPALGDDLIRVYYDVVDDLGGTDSVALATMHASKASTEYTPAVESATLTLYSALLTLQQSALEASTTLAAESVAVTQAAAICTALGLPVVASTSTKELVAPASWDAGVTALKRVNWLLDFASFWSARPDGWGRVVLAEYQAPAERTPVWEFVSGAGSIFLPQVSLESDAFDVPNKCILTSSNAGTPITGTYTNTDPDSPYSTVTRGRTIALVESIDDAIDEADANAKAERRLIAATGATELYTVRHAYCPVTIGDVVKLTWPERGISVRASVQSQEIALGPACMTTSTLKRVWT